MNKILIFGAGFQAEKYIRFFGRYGFLIEVVSYSGKIRLQDQSISKVHSFSGIQDIERSFFSHFEYIIVAVSPITEQDRVLQLLLDNHINIPTIIEKPVTYNRLILEQLVSRANFLFFIDEVCISESLEPFDIDSISISIVKDRSILEHSLGVFLLHPDFERILHIVQFDYNQEQEDSDVLTYDIKINNTHTFCCKRGDYFLSGTLVMKNIFDVNLTFLVTQVFPHIDRANILRSNFLLLQEFLNGIHFDEI